MGLLLNLSGPKGEMSIDVEERLDKGTADTALAQTME